MGESKRVVFLDYDDVVNSPMWVKKPDGEWRCKYNYPSDNAVNNMQAVQWVSEFCQKYGYSIVVSSTWRSDDNYKDCLFNAGLREGIRIDGRTPFLRFKTRGDEIHAYLEEHPEIEMYLIFDDMSPYEFNGHEDNFLRVKHGSFGIEEFSEACRMHERLVNKNNTSEV